MSDSREKRTRLDLDDRSACFSPGGHPDSAPATDLSGPWRGRWEQDPMVGFELIEVEVTGGDFCGRGTDEHGEFELTGLLPNRGAVRLTKRYTRSDFLVPPSITYEGTWDGSIITGQWRSDRSPDRFFGPFELWPKGVEAGVERVTEPGAKTAVMFHLERLVWTAKQLHSAPGSTREYWRLGTAYADYVRDVPTALRESLEAWGAQSDQEDESGDLLLFGAALFDPSRSIASSAALDFCQRHRPSGVDPLEGVKLILDAMSHDECEVFANRGATLVGVLHLGDERVNPLLASVVDTLYANDVLAATQMYSPVLNVSILKFWVDWLEQIVDDPAKEGDFGAICGTLAGYAQERRRPEVLRVRRNFGNPDGADPVEILELRRFTDVAAEVIDRLKRIEPRESYPKLLPKVIAYWEQAAEELAEHDGLRGSGEVRNDS